MGRWLRNSCRWDLQKLQCERGPPEGAIHLDYSENGCLGEGVGKSSDSSAVLASRGVPFIQTISWMAASRGFQALRVPCEWLPAGVVLGSGAG